MGCAQVRGRLRRSLTVNLGSVEAFQDIAYHCRKCSFFKESYRLAKAMEIIGTMIADLSEGT